MESFEPFPSSLNLLDVPTLLLTYFMLLATFTVAFAALYHVTRERRIGLWLLSNLCVIVTFVLIAFRPDLPKFITYQLHSIPMMGMAYFRVLATLPRADERRFRSISLSFFIIVPLINFLMPTSDNHVRLAFNSAMLGLLLGLIPFCFLRSEKLRQSIGGKWIAITFSLIALVFIGRSVASLMYKSDEPIGSFVPGLMEDRGDGSLIIGTLVTAVLLIAITHISFLVFILEKSKARELRFKIQAAREGEQLKQAEKRQEEMARSNEERENLLGILTHEVRQPLNNASAVLQKLMSEFELSKDIHLRDVARNAHRVMDQVTLALSNAIIAASLLDRKSDFKSARCEVLPIIELSILDNPTQEIDRIKLRCAPDAEFITADPILFRIAMRNLIDNALKYSPAGSNVFVDAYEDDQRMGVKILVRNEEIESAWSDKIDVFAARVRGKHETAHGSGLGLFIVSEIAKLHDGSVQTWRAGRDRVFEIFLPD